MITNERQYRISKSEAEKFRIALSQFAELELVKQGVDPVIAAAQREALLEQLGDLTREIEHYEMLRDGGISELATDQIGDLGKLLIGVRIARGFSQRELADRLSMKEQQIQRYEQDEYRSASINRLAEVAESLSLAFSIKCVLLDTSSMDNTFEPKLQFDSNKLPYREMSKRGWLSAVELPESLKSAPVADLAAMYVDQAYRGAKVPALMKQNVRVGGKYDFHAFVAWQARILEKARKLRSQLRPPSGASLLATIDGIFLKRLVALSAREDGPARAVGVLREKGVLVVFERHLSETHLDGAAMLIDDATPVIGMTLRFDRLDNFWFVLMHELAHVLCHWEQGLRDGFFDDTHASAENRLEIEADDFARNALIPDAIWQNSFVRFAQSESQVESFAQQQEISPAIVSGRIHRERNNFKLFPKLVGQGTVREKLRVAGLLES